LPKPPRCPLTKTPDQLRSARWFAPDDLRAFGHRSRAMQMGYGPEDWQDRPVIAILNTWSDAQPCHAHFKHRVEDISAASCKQAASRWNCRRCP